MMIYNAHTGWREVIEEGSMAESKMCSQCGTINPINATECLACYGKQFQQTKTNQQHTQTTASSQQNNKLSHNNSNAPWRYVSGRERKHLPENISFEAEQIIRLLLGKYEDDPESKDQLHDLWALLERLKPKNK